MPRLTIPIILFLSLCLTAFTSIGVHAFSTAIQPSEAQQAINVAQIAINRAVGELTLADMAGAQITDLVTNLNTAIDDLNTAWNAFNSADYSSAISFAENAQSTAEGVSSEAQNRRSLAQLNALKQGVIIFTLVAVSIVLGYLLITRWRDYQQKRKRELLRMEIRLPEEGGEGESNE